jgi:hypothetical protein
MKLVFTLFIFITSQACVKEKVCSKNKITEVQECQHDRCRVKFENGSMAILKDAKVDDIIEMCQEK